MRRVHIYLLVKQIEPGDDGACTYMSLLVLFTHGSWLLLKQPSFLCGYVDDPAH